MVVCTNSLAGRSRRHNSSKRLQPVQMQRMPLIDLACTTSACPPLKGSKALHCGAKAVKQQTVACAHACRACEAGQGALKLPVQEFPSRQQHAPQAKLPNPLWEK